MNLKEMAQQIINNGYNPETDPVSDFENLPDGEYDAILTNVQWKVNDKGTEWLSFTFEILNDGFENRKFFGNIFFSSEKMLQQNIKRTLKYGVLFGINIDPDDFDSPEITLVEAFKAAAGQQVTLTLKTSKSGFQNFELSEYTPF